MKTERNLSRNRASDGAALRWAALLVAILPLLAAVTAPANGLGPTECESLLTNGSFETTPRAISDGDFEHFSDVGAEDVAGWELVAGDAIEIQRNINGSAADGDHWLELASSSPTTISQTVTVTPGDLYELRFAYSDRPGFGSDNEFRATWAGVERTLRAPAVGRTSWQYARIVAPAPADGTGTVTFEDVSGGDPRAGMLIDDVTLCRVEVCTRAPHGLEAWWPFDRNEAPDDRRSRFTDIAADRLAFGRPAPAVVEGVVDRAVRFAGGADQLVVASDPGIDFGAGQDFSIDFWIRTEESSGLSILLEKRRFIPEPPLGYQVFLFGGDVGMQLSTGEGPAICSFDPAVACTNFVSEAFVADGEWHFVAITVDRDDPEGLRFYVDGVEAGRFDPTVRSGSLANGEELRIGGPDQEGTQLRGFAGDLDELEIFRRELSAEEVGRIFAAGSAGKCKASVAMRWDNPVCVGEEAVAVPVTVCNESTEDRSYELLFGGLPPGGSCNVAGPTEFTPLFPPGPLAVPASQCRTVEVLVGAGELVAGERGCIRTIALEQETGQGQTATGKVYPTPGFCPSADPSPVEVPPGGSEVVTFLLRDTGFGGGSLDLVLESFGPDMEPDPGVVRLRGNEPGEPLRGMVTVPAGGELEIPISVSVTGLQPGTLYDLLLSTADGDPLVSTTVRPTTDPCESDLTENCLTEQRFRVEAHWRTLEGTSGSGQAVPLTSDTGYFWFFEPDNVELVVKVLDACSFADRFWVFAGGLTNVEVELTVTDTLTGESKIYTNAQGTAFQPIQDTDAFATCDAAGGAGLRGGPAGREALTRLFDGPSSENVPPAVAPLLHLVEPVTVLPLGGSDRFEVEVSWATSQGTSGQGEGVALTEDTGYFWFFDEDNVEVVVKVLDVCVAPFDRFWVFAAGLTDVAVEIQVTDTLSGQVKTYTNDLGTPFQPIQDTEAFATCP